MKKIDLVTLGCSKNLVDSEGLKRQLEAIGYEVEHDSSNPNGDIAIINTCGFIGDAKEESIQTILDFADNKKKGNLEKIIVMGCLSQRYKKELIEELPEIDAFYGKFDNKSIIKYLGYDYRADLRNERSITTPSHFAYLKISEGCNRTCSYCAIPLITGKHKSRPFEEIIEEANSLAQNGVKELQVIAQDLSYYGLDLYKKRELARLTDELGNINNIEWVRLHYAYPAGFPFDLLYVIKDNPHVCNYMDIALQHISDNMLKLMRRNINKSKTLDLIDKMRSSVPDLHLRTTLITGHPGETEKDFYELLDFVRDAKFERLGVFPYSHEDDTYAFLNYKDDIPDEVKQERANLIMEVQEQISADINSQKVGQELKVIIDRKENNSYVGRTEFDSPEVDPEVIITANDNEEIKIGEFYNVKITEAEAFDLFGKIVK